MVAEPTVERLLVATTNPGKFGEIAELLGSLPIELVSLDKLAPAPPVAEDGVTFTQNAAKKAQHYAAWSGMWALGEDSGLEVDALGGAPGVYSARYAGPEASDAANNVKLVNALAGVPMDERQARFRCAMVLAAPDRVLAQTEGTVEGCIIDQPRGHNGFGYDPHFFVPEQGCTTAELPRHRKNEISHRGQALRAMRQAIHALLTKHYAG